MNNKNFNEVTALFETVKGQVNQFLNKMSYKK